MPDSNPPPLSRLAPVALFLDFDGTLVELAEAPGAIAVPSGLKPLLDRLAAKLEGRLAIVSGRAVEDLRRHLGGPAAAVLSGSHGAELHYADGRRIPVSAPPGLAEAREAVRRFAAGGEGLLIEEKPAGVALHYRLAPQRALEADDFLEALAERTGLVLQRGKMVAELRPEGIDKGAALRRLMGEPPFAGARPVFVGDDLTDEDAFRAAGELGGEGVLVGPARTTAARWRLDGVAEVNGWLEAASYD
ncbi:MAG TPA: trehalose-phosphatase [Allosphingosinicella sp.]|jgi:trehalose 6-phosphate phosphatase|nr:trehalose-phosphatase [Allosphingosinicella sp.]